MNASRVVAIVQARMRSKRLPGKVLLPIRGEPMLTWVVDRTRMARIPDEVVVATTTDPSDDEIVEYCQAHGYSLHRGHPKDVLDRYHGAALDFEAGIIVRITADCPLIDPGLIDKTLKALIEAEKPVDFAANRLPWKRTYPIGLDVEVG
jgi:spore coat polysaccharide biosynthesis protein SpsF